MTGRNCFNGVTFRWLAGAFLSLLTLIAIAAGGYATRQSEAAGQRLDEHAERLAVLETTLDYIAEGVAKLVAAQERH